MEKCWICGKEMVNTVGGCYHCPTCGVGVNDGVFRTSSNCDMPLPQGFGKQEGWVCPVCGRGVAPWVDVCPCQGSEMQITYGTSTGNGKEVNHVDTELERLFKLNDERVAEMISFYEEHSK